jgi:hypothetical protein
MNKIIVTLALLGAIAIMLYQVVNWKEVAEEYRPIANAYHKVADMLPTDAEITESLPVSAIADPTVVTWEADTSTMLVDPDSPEINNINYDWLKRMADRAYLGYKADLKEAFNNDGIIRENEYYMLLGRVNDYHNAQESQAKKSLKEFLAE